ncbi:hypothetical protein [Aureibaculum conchae]|uniref:hypothetical protein n=1 Tax=Aureibaculum sp. 2308TA14-22 TaxID=3108392 RepID=UPI00339B4C34
MKKIFDIALSILVIVVAILSLMHIDFPGRRIIIYVGLVYFLVEYVRKIRLKKKEV